MNMRCDPNWADHAREDWIFEQHQKEQEKIKQEQEKKESENDNAD